MKPMIAWILVPSKNARGKYNVRIPGQAGNLSIDEAFNINFTDSDGNYEQFTRNGLAVEVAPGSDQHPDAPTVVLLPPGS